MKCNFCDKEIEWPLPYNKGALPINPDGSEHRCKSESTAEPQTKLQTKADPITDEHIKKQILLLTKIEGFVKRWLVAEKGSQDISVQQLGLWVKLIYQNMSS